MEEMIFQRNKKNQIMCGGYKINNLFKNQNVPPIHGSVFPQKGGGNNLAIPMGLFFLQQGLPSIMKGTSKQEVPDDLYSKLLALAEYKKKIKLSRKKKKRRKKKTRKR